MAIYHLHVKPIKRSEGRSAVASAAYRAAQRLTDRRTGITWDYTDKAGVEFAEILAPPGAPAWVYEREELWNAVEQVEVRHDAQLAREIRLALPIELDLVQQSELLREFVSRECVRLGMVADFAIHRDNPENPHAHVMLSLRDLKEEGFGLKNRAWNATAQLQRWRQAWETTVNAHLAQAGHAVRIDHRTLKAQGLALTPGRKLGLGAERRDGEALPEYLAERVAEQRRIAQENGRKIIADPEVALTALTHGQATFTHHEIAKFLHSRTDGAEQFQTAYLKVTTSPQLVILGLDERNKPRFTTGDMLVRETELLKRGERMAAARTHPTADASASGGPANAPLSAEQAVALRHLTAASALSVMVGVAGAGKSTLLEAARRSWERAGFRVRGAALSGIAAENLENASGIRARTLASWTLRWRSESGGDAARDALTARDILVIDEAGMIGTRQLGEVLERAEAAGAKVVLVGDPEQLQAIEAGAAFRGVAAEIGYAELKQVRRQQLDWQRAATQLLATGRTDEALEQYRQEHRIHAEPSREQARAALLTAWERGAALAPVGSRLMLAYTREDAQALNQAARAQRLARGQLRGGTVVVTERGEREIAVGERLYFLRNDRNLGVKNGTLGTVEAMGGSQLVIRPDHDTRRVHVDLNEYAHLEYGYAATIHKAQGTTVDRTYVLATPHLDRHATYVALSRHRHSAALFYGTEDFVRQSLTATLSRARPKTLAHDYLERAVPRTENLEAIAARAGYAALRYWKTRPTSPELPTHRPGAAHRTDAHSDTTPKHRPPKHRPRL